MARADSERSDSAITFLPLPVSDDQSANRNIIRRINSSKVSVSNFIKLKIIMRASEDFELSVAKSTSFESLACHIEADYYLKTGKLVPCCIVASEDWIPFHLDWNVGNHLTNGSIVRIFSYTDSNQLFSH